MVERRWCGSGPTNLDIPWSCLMSSGSILHIIVAVVVFRTLWNVQAQDLKVCWGWALFGCVEIVRWLLSWNGAVDLKQSKKSGHSRRHFRSCWKHETQTVQVAMYIHWMGQRFFEQHLHPSFPTWHDWQPIKTETHTQFRVQLLQF